MICTVQLVRLLSKRELDALQQAGREGSQMGKLTIAKSSGCSTLNGTIRCERTLFRHNVRWGAHFKQR